MFYATDTLIYDTESGFNALNALVILNFTRKFLQSGVFTPSKAKNLLVNRHKEVICRF